MNTQNKTFENIISPIANELKRVDEITREKLKTGVPVIDEASLHLFSGGGKRIRASLVIISSGLFDSINDDVIDIAAAAEIVHAATLIHDDIIDQSMLRRGNVSVPKKLGHRISVLAGDFMYTVSLDIAVKTENTKLFPPLVDATKNMVKGELYQLQYSNIGTINRTHYLKTIELKTARFMAACSELGALISDSGEENRRRLYDFGLNLGMGFQIIDDALDLMHKSRTTGKDYGNDLLEGKITLPVIYYLEKLDEKDKNSFIHEVNNLSRDNIDSLLSLIQKSGEIENAVTTANSYIEKAVSLLEELPDSQYRVMLKEIADFIIYRNY